jgi:hypothetical protein
MKKFLVLWSVILIFGLASNAGAIPFYGFDEGGMGSADMVISTDGNTLTATLDNTSPVELDDGDDGDGGNSPGIAAFGFSLDPDELSWTSWTLTALSSDDFQTPIRIGSDMDGGPWEMDTSFKGITLDYIFNIKGMDRALYNPDAFSDPNNTLPGRKKDVYFTTAELTMVFDQEPSLNTEELFSPFIMMKNVGIKGEGSLKLAPVPEPASMLLVGAGLIGLAAVSRKKFFKKS